MNSENNKAGNGKASHSGGVDAKASDLKTNPPIQATEKQTEPEVSQPGAPQATMQAPGERHTLLAAMRTRWVNFGETDVKNVKTRDDLSAAIQSKYGITAEQANTQVKEWSVGRQF